MSLEIAQPSCGNSESRLRLFETSESSDATIVCNGRKFKVHEFALAERSEYFSRMLTSNFEEAQTREIVQDSISAELMEKVLRHIYGSRIELSLSEALEVLSFADMCLLDGLKEECVNAIEQRLTADNALDIYERLIVCPCLSRTGLVLECERLIFEALNKIDCYESRQFLKASYHLLISYFSEYQYCQFNEDEVVLAILSWWKANPDTSYSQIIELINKCVNT